MAIKRKPVRWTDELFRQKINELSPTIKIVGDYKKLSDHIECVCAVCNTVWFPTAGNLLKSTGCPECSKKKQSDRMKNRKARKNNWTQESFVSKVKKIDSNIEVIGIYKGTSKHIECRCKNCNSVWKPIANNLLQGKSHCPECSRIRFHESTQMTRTEFYEQVSLINENIEILGEYISSKTPILCRCKICGNEWNPIAYSLLSGRGCRKCAYKQNGLEQLKSHDDFIEELSKINNTIMVLNSYEGANKPIECKCKLCGNEWKTTPHRLLTSRGCPECAHSSTSYVEQFLLIAFRHIFGNKNILSRDKKEIGEELDIFIPQYRLAIEPGSWYFHKQKRKKDLIKNDLCAKNNIALINIYYDFDGDYIDIPNAFCYSQDLADKKNQSDLISLFYTILKNIGVVTEINDEEWEKISNLAYIKSRKINTQQFKDKLYVINPNIDFLGDYKSSRTKALCRCHICGNEWKASPGDLLSGRGCLNCYNKRRGESQKTSQEDYIKKVCRINPDIELLSPYLGSHKRIQCKCKKCDYIWSPYATYIVNSRASGCPKCAGTLKYDTESFSCLMKTINPCIEIIGEYINTKTEIKCRCLVCGFEWKDKPQYLRKGKKCPICLKREKHKNNNIVVM